MGPYNEFTFGSFGNEDLVVNDAAALTVMRGLLASLSLIVSALVLRHWHMTGTLQH